MSSTSQYTTFSDLYTGLVNAVRITTGVTATDNQAKRAINVALQDMHLGTDYKFPWAERHARLVVRPSYTTGTVSINRGSATLTGTSTLWTTTDAFSIANARAGGKIKIDGGRIPYLVDSVGGAGTITLSSKFTEADVASGSSYVYFEDEYALASDFLRPLDMQSFDDECSIELIPRTEFRRRYPLNATLGSPSVACIVDGPPSGSTTLVRKVKLAPPPSAYRTIPYSYITSSLVVSSAGVAQTGFSADSDEPVIPLRYRHALFYHALYNWYRDKKDDARSAEAKSDYTDIMLRLMADVDVGGVRPQFRPRTSRYADRARRPWR